jgi:hypothetical protein
MTRRVLPGSMLQMTVDRNASTRGLDRAHIYFA